MTGRFLPLTLAALLCVAPGVAVAQGTAAPGGEITWEQDLSYEIDLVYDCEVAFLSHVVEREVEGKQMIMAKVHCTDQRAFDAQRFDPLDPFHFSPCEDRDKTTC